MISVLLAAGLTKNVQILQVSASCALHAAPKVCPAQLHVSEGYGSGYVSTVYTLS